MITPSVPRICEQCGKSFLGATGEVNRGRARFCDRECAREQQRVQALVRAPDRFWAQVDASGDCWLWTGRPYKPRPDGFNYGRWYRYEQGRKVSLSAHRLAYELLVAPVPRHLHLDHLCRNHRCVNPDHLQPVTPQTNTLRGYSPISKQVLTTRCPQGHSYDEANTYLTPTGRRDCRACRQAAHLRWLARQKGA
jgi:hypothetical protein